MRNFNFNWMKNAAKKTQTTGGGTSQSNSQSEHACKKGYEHVNQSRLASDMPPTYLPLDSLSIVSRQSDFFTRVWKYAAMMLMVLCLGTGEIWGDTASWMNNTMSPASYFTLGSNTSAATNAQTIGGTSYTHSINMTSKSGQSSNNTNGYYIRFTLTSTSNVSVLFMASGGSRTIRVCTGWSYDTSTNATQLSNGATPTDGVKGTSSSASNGKTETLSINNLAAGTYYICGSGSVCVFKITISAPAKTYTVTAATNNVSYGSASSSASSLDATETATITATPETGYRFVSWAVSGTGSTLSSTTTNPTTLTMGTANTTVTATFEAIPTHSVSAVTSTGTNTYGTVSAASSTVAEGSTTVITATPAKGYRVASWAVSGTGASISPSGTSNSNTTTLTMGTANATVTVTFEEKPCPTSGTVFSMAMKKVDTKKTLTASEVVDLDSYATITGGNVKLTNTGSAKGQIINANPGVIYYDGNAAYMILAFDCPLQTGDSIIVTYSSTTSKLSFTSAASIGTSDSTILSDGKYYFIVPAKFNGLDTLYAWRSHGKGMKMTGLKVTRPAPPASTWKLKGSFDTWGDGYEMTGSGTVSVTRELSADTQYEFKITDGTTWYGNSDYKIGGTTTTSEVATSGDGNMYLNTTEAGDYVFSFNTSTHVLTVTYPDSYTVYYSNSGSWSNVYVYRFTDLEDGEKNNISANDGAWPGTLLTGSDIIDHCGDYYEVDTKGFKNVIINDNGSNQTGDMPSADGDGKYVAGTGTSWSDFPTFSVTYNKNGDGAGGAGSVTGSVPTDSDSPYDCEADVAVLGNTGSLALTGYTFSGWNTAANGSGTSKTGGQTLDDISVNITFYAQWTANEYTITLDNESATTAGATNVSATYDADMPSIAANLPAKTGYIFQGYFTEKVGAGTKYINADGSSAKTADFTAATTLYAAWKLATPTISFSDDTDNEVTITATKGASIYYTTDGSTPTESSTEYEDVFTIRSNRTIKAIAVLDGAINSDVSSLSCTYQTPPRTFKSGEKIYFKDAGSNISNWECLWKVSSGAVYAYFWNDTENAWSTAGTLASGTENEASAIYRITVPGSGKEYTKVLFSRGPNNASPTFSPSSNQWAITSDQRPNVDQNLYKQNTNDAVDGKYNGSWGSYAPSPALVGEFNMWNPDANVFGDYSSDEGGTFIELEGNTTYTFKVLVGEAYCGVGSGTITNTTAPWWHLDGVNDVYITTGEAGEYAFKWNRSTYYFGAYYPQARLAKNKYIYFDANNLDASHWNAAAFSTKFIFKSYDNSENEVGTVECSNSNSPETKIYYAVVPNNDYLGFIRVDRWPTDFTGSRWNYSGDAVASDRSSSKQNCIITKDAHKAYDNAMQFDWKTYCPPTNTPTLSDNSTTVIAGTSGDGNKATPYLVATDGTIKVTAAADQLVEDDNMTQMFDFEVNKSSVQDGEGSTFNYSSLSNNTVYKVTVKSYNYYNSTSGTKTVSDTLYYKALNTYSIDYNKGTNGTGDNVTDLKIYGIDKALRGEYFTRTGYTQTGWATEDGGEKVYNLSVDYTGNADLDLYPVWTANTYSVTLNTNSGTINSGDVTSYTYGVGATLPTDVTRDHYRFAGWYADDEFEGDEVTAISSSATGDKEYWAKWIQLYAITDGEPSNGSIAITDGSSAITEAAAGDAVYIVATPSSGYEFSEWSIYKTSDSKTTVSPAAATASTSFTMPAYAVTVDASFVLKTYDVTTTLNHTTKESGTTGTGAATHGTEYSATFAAADGYVLPSDVTVTIGGVAQTKGTGYTWSVSAGVGTFTVPAAKVTGNIAVTIASTEDECGITLTQFGTQYKTSSPRRLYSYTSNSFDERFIIENDDSNTHGVTYSSTDSLYLYLNNGKKFSVHASDVLKDSIFEDVTKVKFNYRAGKSGKSITLTFDVFVGATKIGSISKAITDQTWYSETILVSPAKDGRVTFKNTGSSSDYALHFNNINICGTLPTPCTEITPTWSTDYSSTTLDVGGSNSSTPTVGTDGSSGAVSFSSSDTDIATVNSSTGVVTPKKSGSVTITATVAADDVNNYCEGSITKTFTIRAGVTYDGNSKTSGSVPTDDNKYAAGATVTTKTNSGSLERTGYVFNGWNTKSDGTGTHYEPGATFSMPTKTSGVKLYAEWVGYATSWEWWNSGQSNNSTTFTYLTSKNYILSFASSGSTDVASWDMSGGALYRGVKIKTKDHNMSFWVETGKRVSITFGYMSTKPTFTVGGVNKAGDLSTSTTDSATVTYTTSADTKFYIENETATNTAFTIKSVKIVDACTTITPSLTPSSKTLYPYGGTPRQVTLALSGNTGSGEVTWTSSNEDVATVTSAGVVTAVAPGTATITASIAATGDYCEGEAECTITVPALVTQTINVGNSEAAASWGTPPNMSFNDPTSTLTQNAVIDVSAGYTFDKAAEYKGNRSGRYMTAQIKAANGVMSDSKYLSLSFNSPSHDVRVGEVIVPIQPVTDKLVAKASISDGTTTVWSAQSDSLAAGSITDAKFTFSPTVLKAGTITVKVYVYGQPTDKGFRLANTIYVNGAMLVDQKFTGAGNWSDPANWDGGSLPDIYHDVVLEKVVTVDIDHATAKSIVIYNDGDTKTGKLTIQPNKGMEIAGTIRKTTDGSSYSATGEADLVLESNEDGNASLIFNNSNSCAATVQMYSKAAIDGDTWNWQYVGTPFTGSIPLYNYYGSWMYKWNNGWEVVHGNDPLIPFAGYCLTQESATTHVMGGTLVATDGNDQTITMDEETDKVLANSWTAPIYIGAFTTEGVGATFTSTPANIYLFNTGAAKDGANDETANKYEAGTYLTIPVHSAPYSGDSVIASMQGFFVTTNGDGGAEGTIKLKYDELVRPVGDRSIVGGAMHAPRRAKAAEAKPDVMKIRANGSKYSDRVVILAREDFSEGFDNGWDGEKLSFGAEAPSVYVINQEGGYDAVSAIPGFEGTLVGFRAGTNNSCTMTFEYDGEEIWYLNDLQTQQSTLIDSELTYTFSTSSYDSEARFIISATPIRKITTGVETVTGYGLQGTGVRKLIINDKIYIIRGGRMFTVDGQMVK